jgi:hypothetical protein
MIKTMTAFSDEVDDAEYLVDELLKQLDLDGLLPNTVGILACGSDFVHTGAAKTVCERLPFPVIGLTTNACAVRGTGDMVAPLSLLVMTSDTASFRLGLTEDFTEDYRGQFKRAWDKASEGMEGPPALVLCYLPLFSKLSGARLLEAFSQAALGAPLFGNMCVSEEADFVSSSVLSGGEFHREKAAFVLVYGDVKPRFFLGTISEEKFMKSKGIVTEVRDGMILAGVSGKKARDFFIELGLSVDEQGSLLFPALFPLSVDYNDGSAPILRAMITPLPDGSIILAGDVAPGATLSVSTVDAEEVRQVAQKTLDEVAAEEGGSAILIHSCAARYHVAETVDRELEMEIVRSRLDSRGGYFITYSAGEICPVPNQAGILENRFHNFTIIACII